MAAMTRAWLDNGILGYDCAPPEGKLEDMALTALACMQWLDETRVQGDSTAETLAKEALAFFKRDFDATELVGEVGAILRPIKQATVRLKGLVESR